MAVVLRTNSFTINNVFSLSYNDAPLAVRSHLRRSPGTVATEVELSRYVASGFSIPRTSASVDSVCRWGGSWGSAIATRIRRGNTAADIASKLTHGYIARSARASIRSVCGIVGLGIPFGSKHLRMMKPMEVVVLDNILSSRLKYRLSEQGYSEICDDCRGIADRLTRSGINNPMDNEYRKLGFTNPRGQSNVWWPADVELALFSECHPRNWSSKGSWAGINARNKPAKAMAPLKSPYNDKFELFWSWLQTARNAPTLSGRSIIAGKANSTALDLTTSNNKVLSPIKKDTVANYCADAFWSGFEDLQGNRRWVAALLLEYMSQL